MVIWVFVNVYLLFLCRSVRICSLLLTVFYTILFDIVYSILYPSKYIFWYHLYVGVVISSIILKFLLLYVIYFFDYNSSTQLLYWFSHAACRPGPSSSKSVLLQWVADATVCEIGNLSNCKQPFSGNSRFHILRTTNSQMGTCLGKGAVVLTRNAS